MQEFIYSKEDLASMLINMVSTGQRWSGYKRTVEVAKFWNQIITGKQHEDILLSLKKGESKEQQKQRVRLYNSRTKYVANKIIRQIQEVYRSDNIYNEIYFSEKKDDDIKKIDELNERLKNFSGKKSVREWLRTRYLRLNISDPNAFIVVNFVSDGKNVSGFYPIEVKSSDVISRQYINGTLQYLAFVEHTQAKVVKEGKIKTEKAFKYWMFGHEYAILLHKVPEGAEGIGTPIDIDDSEGADGALYGDATTYSWYYNEYTIKAQQVPAFCVGYIPDPENNDETYQSILYPAEELFKELIWTKSSYDIHRALHGIAQKYAFVPNCEYNDQKNNRCDGGKMPDGTECPACHGTGQMPFHTSEQDIITIAMPRDKSEIWDLSKMIYYQPIPKDIIEMTRQDIAETERAISLAIFNISIIDKSELAAAKTATEIRSNTNATNNVLYEFGLHDAQMYEDIVNQIAIYSNLWREDLVIDYSYPNDFNLESLPDLFASLKEAQSVGAPTIVKKKINTKIISKLCIGDAFAIEEYEAREKWRPFQSDAQALSAPELDPARILWLYYDQIFRNLENQVYKTSESGDVWFAMLPEEKQKEEIDKQVQFFTAQYIAAKGKAPDITVPRLQ